MERFSWIMALVLGAVWALLPGCSGGLSSMRSRESVPGRQTMVAATAPDPADSTPNGLARRGGPERRIGSWLPLFQGIDYAEGEVSSFRLARAIAVRVDLTDPSVDFLVTPSNGDAPLETDSRFTSDFLTAFGCQVAINASAFGPFDPNSSASGVHVNVQGLSVSRGDLYSPDEAGRDALLISKEKKAWVARSGMSLDGVYNAVAGFGVILDDGKNCGAEDAMHPRTAAGVSEDGRYLILMVIDGRQIGYSLGATTKETAEWIRSFGAHYAVNLDGGGSTTLVVSDGQGGARLLNRPIHRGIPGDERAVANHLGVFAGPLK